MLSKEEIKLVHHRHDAGKGLIWITETITRRRMDESNCDLLTDVAECVNHKGLDSVERGTF